MALTPHAKLMADDDTDKLLQGPPMTPDSQHGPGSGDVGRAARGAGHLAD